MYFPNNNHVIAGNSTFDLPVVQKRKSRFFGCCDILKKKTVPSVKKYNEFGFIDSSLNSVVMYDYVRIHRAFIILQLGTPESIMKLEYYYGRYT